LAPLVWRLFNVDLFNGASAAAPSRLNCAFGPLRELEAHLEGETSMNRFTWALVLAAAFGTSPKLFAQNLVPNGDFEAIQLDEAEAPILDAYGYQAPSGWFRSITNPGTHPTPLTELINPANMNNAAGDSAGDDSDGNGVSSLALNFVEDAFSPPFGVGADWRSEAFETVPGETLFFSIDVKFLGVSQEEYVPGTGLFEGILAQVRSFDQLAPDGGTAGSFKGEHNVTLQSRDFTPSQWTTVTSSFVVPADGFFTDVRVSTNLFIPPSPLFAGQVLFDRLSITRITADFDNDGNVDGDDLTVWKNSFGAPGADANGDGVSDGADFLAWQREFGLGVAPAASSLALLAVPEPGSAALASLGVATLLMTRRRRFDPR
jgi:hypothetical protein